MNILTIAKKEIKQNIRDIRTLVFMLAFPIVLMLILGSALTSDFQTGVSVDHIQVLYKNTARTAIADSFDRFAAEAGKSGIHFRKVSHHTNGKTEVEKNNVTAYVEIGNKGIRLYGSDRSSIEVSIVQGMLTAYAGKYNMVTAIVNTDGTKMETALSGSPKNNFIKEQSLAGNKQPGSMDYYAMTMTTMIALYGAIYASSLIHSERVRNTALRLVAAPIRKNEIFMGKILGCFTVNFLCLLSVVAFSYFVYKANWGQHIGTVILVLLTEVILAVSFGLGISYMAKSANAARMIIMIVLQIASYFGGAFFKVDHANGALGVIHNLSPLTWVNQAITKIIYTNDLSAAIPAISLNLGISALFLGIAIISFQKREGL